MIKQIALYRLYLGYVKKGYDITKDGLHTVSDIMGGEFNLHQSYYNSLQEINPVIKRQARLKETAAYCADAAAMLHNLQASVYSSQVFEISEKQYVSAVVGHMDEELDRLTAELEMVITPGRIRMKDDERLQKLNAIYHKARDAYAFSISFSNDLRLLTTQRKGTLNDVSRIKELYRLP